MPDVCLLALGGNLCSEDRRPAGTGNRSSSSFLAAAPLSLRSSQNLSILFLLVVNHEQIHCVITAGEVLPLKSLDSYVLEAACSFLDAQVIETSSFLLFLLVVR